MELSAFDTLITTPIEEYCANDMGYRQMLRLMEINAEAKYARNVLFGDGVTGSSGKVSDEALLYDYTYTKDTNYLNKFQLNHAPETTTKVVTRNDNVQDYSKDGHNKLYGVHVNLYHDDNGTGSDDFTDEKKTDYYIANRNEESILAKTKKLFNARKVNTIISRFYTDNPNNKPNDVSETASSEKYKLSHGRNLLTYDAERKGIAYRRNGYEDPYCRVWTHHHQYSQYRGRMIRPFSVDNSFKLTSKEGLYTTTKTSEFHKWTHFTNHKYRKEIGDKGVDIRGWKADGAKDYELSVLNNETGIVNIAPKFLGGAEKNIHTKDCMFSIENLAWQGYDPYSFEKALSWEQRGPFGGRIMWFPPYGLRFSEDTSVQWNEHSFIGRGENVFTYTNTARSGTLEFMMVVDHPSIVDYATWYDPKDLKDSDILRFFAGCDGGDGSLRNFAMPTPLTDEYLEKRQTKTVNEETFVPQEIPSDEEIELNFYVFYPNNYSGYYDQPSSDIEAIAYLLAGNGTQWLTYPSDVTLSTPMPLKFDDMKDSIWKGNGYEMANSGSNIEDQEASHNYIIGTTPNWNQYKSKTYVPDDKKHWYYRIDGEYKVESKTGSGQYKNTFDQTLLHKENYEDKKENNLNLNCNVESVKSLFPEEQNNENLYSLAEIAYALSSDWQNITTEGEEYQENDKQKFIRTQSGKYIKPEDERIKKLVEMLDPRESSIYKIVGLNAVGYSNIHGNNKISETNKRRNDFLAEQRAKTALMWIKTQYGHGSVTIEGGNEASKASVKVNKEDTDDVNGKTAKKWRSARVTLKIRKSEAKNIEKLNNENAEKFERFQGFRPLNRTENVNGKEVELFENINEDNVQGKAHRPWYYDKETQQMIVYGKEYESQLRNGAADTRKWASEKLAEKYDSAEGDENNLRYDQEYHFFKQLEAKHPDVFASLKEKLQYFDPAFHSMTPEGFMGRLTFLQQCTRQGDTKSASDKDGYTANNLAFGKPPFCILRLSDFYYQKIVIKNISINYDPLVLDLNQEGIGVVPLIANVTISFNFIGGGDLTGPVRRLQNAMSFNYFANSRLYDNRADRIEYEKTNWETMGAMENHKVNFDDKDGSYFHHVEMAKH